MARPVRAAALSADAISTEGALIAPAVLARIAAQPDNADTRADYRIPKGLTLRDEIARYFRIGQAQFADLFASPTPSAAKTIGFVEALFRDVFGFVDIARAGVRTHGDHQYVVTLEALGGRVPVVVVPPDDRLDRASDHLPGDGRRRSAASAVQDWLNAYDGATWGFCCNGEHLRLVRDNASLTRPAYIEADLRQIFEAESFADFTTLWLLIHASRFGQPGTLPTDCALERWREAGGKEGVAARKRLGDGVKAALKILGTGFLSANPELRQRAQMQQGVLTDLFGQLLRLVYRLIFLLAAEDRGLLHPPDASPAARHLYAQGYSLASLRDRAIRRTAWDAHHDKWDGLTIVFAALAQGQPLLGLPALGGLFATEMTPDLDAARLPNRALMEAIFRLAWLREPAGLVPVNWREMQTEELGSVYEGLLELTPRLTDEARGLDFAESDEAAGHERKTTGSYYTPDALVQALLDSALDPVLDRVEAEADDPAAALLGVTVLDPACGSGHFLLAAGRRIATRVARARTGGVASAEDYRHALRDVARASLHGVDRNPMAVELTKVALWIETVDPGRPLGFLDANIRCGDALLGVFDMKVLADGVPDTAYRPLTGDDAETARFYAARNRDEQRGQGRLDFQRGGGRLPATPLAATWAGLRALPEDSPEQISEKRQRFEAARADRLLYAWGEAADLYIAAFLLAKTGNAPAPNTAHEVPTSGDVWRALADHQVHGQLIGSAVEASRTARAFHWPLEFPDVMTSGGFDVVLGNPPWNVIQLVEEKYFAQDAPEIAELPASEREIAIAALELERPTLFARYVTDKRFSEAINAFSRCCGRYPRTARGKINTYALFSESSASVISNRGRSGLVVETDIATGKDTAEFFSFLTSSRRLISLYDFENSEGIFDIHRSYRFCLLTLGATQTEPLFGFGLTNPGQLSDQRRVFPLTADDIARMNPNTRTAIVIATRGDAEVLTALYRAAPVLIEGEGRHERPSCNITVVQNQFSSSNRTDRNLFIRATSRDVIENVSLVPVLRGSLVHQFDHRFGTFDIGSGAIRSLSDEEKTNPDFEIASDKYVSHDELIRKLRRQNWKREWLLGWRDQVRASDVRTMIATATPLWAADDSFSLLFCHESPKFAAALLANLDSICVDFVVQRKITTFHVRKHVLAQLPIIPPRSYSENKLNYTVSRVLELVYTSHSMAPFARDLGYDGPPFAWNEDRRALLRAELDAFYARAYGLTRDELRYILDPEDAMGPGYPSETFRVLKQNEIRRFNEYRTARLVLAAWDTQEAASRAAGS